MMTLPLVLRGGAREFVVVGGGAVAARKLHSLIKSGCRVTVIAPTLHPEALALTDQFIYLEREATAQEVFPAKSWVVLATDDADLNQALAQAAKAQGLMQCRVDDPSDNDFIFPAVVDRSPLLISISTSGASPALTRHVRQRLEAFLPQDYGVLAQFMETWRPRIKTLFDPTQRAQFWRSWMASLAPEFILNRQLNKAEQLTQSMSQGQAPERGEVWLVGAGPGDPDLLTFKALRLIQAAEVVFYDRLVNPKILDMLPPDAECFYVGKQQSNHSVPQDGINQLLVDAAKAGKKVLRLKGGDPFIFGRGGEEIERLAEAGVAFQVVPGITAANGCAAYAGIPLTHREHAQSVRFVTGHLKDDSCDLPWHELVHPQQTLVIYMGLSGITHICQKLIEAGMSPNTPIALIEKGTLPEQKVHKSTLESMSAYIQGRDIRAPTLTIVGSVVDLHDRLAWR